MNSYRFTKEECVHNGTCNMFLWETNIKKIDEPGKSFIEDDYDYKEYVYRFNEKICVDEKHKIAYIYLCQRMNENVVGYTIYRQVFFE